MERNPHLNTRLGHPHHDIVADDGSVAVPRHVSSFDVTQVPAYNRCDSGYEAGYKMDPHQSPAKSNVGYSRLDSGIDSEFNSLSLEPRSSVAGASPLHSSTSSHQPGNNETEFIEELFEQDAEGDTQLHLAIASSYEDVNALVRLAPKPDYLNIQCSMINGDEVIVGILKSLGADMTLEMESEDSEDIDEDVDSYNYIETSRIVESQA